MSSSVIIAYASQICCSAGGRNDYRQLVLKRGQKGQTQQEAVVQALPIYPGHHHSGGTEPARLVVAVFGMIPFESER